MKVDLSISWALGQIVPKTVDSRLLSCLVAVNEAGSLSAAARRAGLSYRHLWGLLQTWEQQCGAPLVEMQRGRGAHLAPLGSALLQAQQRIDTQLAPQLEQLASQTSQRLTESIHSNQSGTVNIVASHDLGLAVLQQQLLTQAAVRVNLQTQGSLDSLRQLAAGHCDLAGFHVSQPLLGTHHLQPLHNILDARHYGLIRLLTRCQGLMVSAGNPLGLTHLKDVANKHARFINRQPGSGTRLLVDELLEQSALDPSAIEGYANEEFTHLAVAAMVASGAADAGFGIEAAARQFNLEFTATVTEQYWLAFNILRMPDSTKRSLIAVLQSEDFQEQIQKLPGYDPKGAGDLVSVEQAFSEGKHS